MKQFSQFLFLYGFLALVSWTSDALAGNGEGNPAAVSPSAANFLKSDPKITPAKAPVELSRKGLYICSQFESNQLILSDTFDLTKISAPRARITIHDQTSSDPQTERRVTQSKVQAASQDLDTKEKMTKPAHQGKSAWMEFLTKLQRVFSYSTGLVTGV